MNDQILLIIGAALPLIWGIAHIFPTRSVVSGFGEISPDNRIIIAMEWIIEGVALIFIGVMVIIVTLVDQGSVVSFYVYLITATTLIVLAIVSLIYRLQGKLFAI